MPTVAPCLYWNILVFCRSFNWSMKISVQTATKKVPISHSGILPSCIHWNFGFKWVELSWWYTYVRASLDKKLAKIKRYISCFHSPEGLWISWIFCSTVFSQQVVMYIQSFSIKRSTFDVAMGKQGSLKRSTFDITLGKLVSWLKTKNPVPVQFRPHLERVFQYSPTGYRFPPYSI